MSDVALFDLEPVDDRSGPDVTHVLMPDMSYACGGSVLTKRGHFQVGISNWAAIDCNGCREPGESTLRLEIRAMQGRQADVA